MSATCWVYVKRPTGEFVRLSLKRFNDFQFRRGSLDLDLADQQRYLHTAEVTIDLDDRIPRRVREAAFRRMRLAPDGTPDPECDSLERELMFLRSNADLRGTGSERGAVESDSFPGLLEASKRFEARRLDAACTWRPSPSELLVLGVLLSRSIKIQVTARERHLQRLLERSRDHRLLVAGSARSKSWEVAALADAEEESVRAAVAANPATPNHVLERLAWSDSCESVRAAARGHLAWNLSLAMNWASSQQASALYLRKAAGDRRREVRAAVAENPVTPREVLALLQHDPDAQIRALVDRRLQICPAARKGRLT